MEGRFENKQLLRPVVSLFSVFLNVWQVLHLSLKLKRFSALFSKRACLCGDLMNSVMSWIHLLTWAICMNLTGLRRIRPVKHISANHFNSTQMCATVERKMYLNLSSLHTPLCQYWSSYSLRGSGCELTRKKSLVKPLSWFIHLDIIASTRGG